MHTVGEIQAEVPDLECWEVPQHTAHLNDPTKWLLGAYLNQEIAHGQNPVLGWNARNMALAHDSNDNVKPIKAVNQQSRKIDGVSALVCAIHRARVIKDSDTFEYTGLRSV
jgi:phage terminase large subunit-like protein